MCYKNIKVEAVHILFRFKMTGGESPAVLLSSVRRTSLALSHLAVPEAVVR